MIATWGVLAAELLFAPLALWKKSRPWIWLTMIVLHLGIVLMVDFADLSVGMLMIHLFTFDPAWLPAKKGEDGPLKVAFDGECLLCNRTVHFLADEDAANTIRFLKLQSPLGQDMMRRAGETSLDSMLLEADGKLRSRSDGALRIMEALGGHWRAFAWLGRLVPLPLRNAVYNFIAAHRLKWFGKTDACSLPSDAVRSRLISGEGV
jgi:predicted DCC family thiol-disulfide oxidoreductase YuxK